MYSNRRNESARSSRCRTKCVLCVCLSICLVLVVVIVAVSLGVHYGLRAATEWRPDPGLTITDAARSAALYSPGDTRILSYGNSFFCEAISLQSNATQLGLTLQLIDDTPSLNKKHKYNITRSTNTTTYWSFYLHPNSKVKISECTRPASYDGEWTAIDIRGRSNFLSWLRSPNSTFDGNGNIAVNRLQYQPCIENYFLYSYGEHTYFHENEYFYIYYNRNNSDVELDVTITLEKLEYSVLFPISTASCIAGGETSSPMCRLEVPLGSNYQALISVDVPNDVNWEEKYQIVLRCENRAWAFVVVILGSIVVIIIALVVTCACVRCIKRRKMMQSEVQEMTEFRDIDPLKGEQDLTDVPPPSYAASLAYPLPTDEDKTSPPSYVECTTNNV